MKTKRLVVLGLLLLSATAWGKKMPPKVDNLEGTWLPTAAEMSGQAMPEKQRKQVKLVIQGDAYTVTVGDVVDRGSAKWNAAATPKTVDIVGTDGPNKGKTLLGIYELDGDTLRVCYDVGGKGRPTELKSAKGSTTFLVTYQRQKP
jgi:uncharacterized protein (TIGR03067 family)